MPRATHPAVTMKSGIPTERAIATPVRFSGGKQCHPQGVAQMGLRDRASGAGARYAHTGRTTRQAVPPFHVAMSRVYFVGGSPYNTRTVAPESCTLA
jgi:hypothetical protein